MKHQIFITGAKVVPQQLAKEKTFNNTTVDNPYDLRELLSKDTEDKIIVAYLPFLETRHFDLYHHFQTQFTNVQTIFIVNELSSSMKLRLKSKNEFMVFWKTEEGSLVQNIKKYLQGRELRLREEKREPHQARGLLSPSLLPAGIKERDFKPMLPGHFSNLSDSGSCLKIQSQFYEPKDFVKITYQTKDGEFVCLEGQVRWTRWNKVEQTQELGLHFVSSHSLETANNFND